MLQQFLPAQQFFTARLAIKVKIMYLKVNYTNLNPSRAEKLGKILEHPDTNDRKDS